MGCNDVEEGTRRGFILDGCYQVNCSDTESVKCITDTLRKNIVLLQKEKIRYKWLLCMYSNRLDVEGNNGKKGCKTCGLSLLVIRRYSVAVQASYLVKM